MTRVVMTHGYSDDNKGDSAIVLGTVAALREYLGDNVAIEIQSVYRKSHPDFDRHHRFLVAAGVTVREGAFPSPYSDESARGIRQHLIAVWRLLFSALTLRLASKPGSRQLARRLNRLQYEALEALRQADLVIAKGGQYLYNDQGGLRGILYLWRMSRLITIAHQVDNPPVLLGHSIGPIAGRLPRVMLRKALRRTAVVVVRERLSEKFVRQLDASINVHLAPDLAFFVRPSRSLPQAASGQGSVGVTVVNWSFPGRDRDVYRQRYETALVEALQATYARHGLQVLLIPQVVVRHDAESDVDVLQRVQERLEALRVPTVLVTEDLAPDELAALYGRCEVLLATRLHSSILAAVGGTPSVLISYQGPKSQGIAKMLGLDPPLPIDDLSAEELAARLSRLFLERAHQSKQLPAKVVSARRDIAMMLRQVIVLQTDSGMFQQG